ncbi:hypothetical protein TIFTF001_029289 [Ficus carica]|uniref:Uncharacterized protein n=1 Tax=Ficus carica TaxID=3494 RepID=A0AA88DS12_FICCA|nr:hypothetical protein TIFTF001_029289 [Ficus carica]
MAWGRYVFNLILGWNPAVSDIKGEHPPSRRARNRQWRLTCRRFFGSKDEDMTIARRLLGVEAVFWQNGGGEGSWF